MGLEFSEKVQSEISGVLSQYPDRQSATLPLLHIAQREFGYISGEVVQLLSDILEIPAPVISDTASFYTMFYRKPVGKYVIQICSTLSCALCGSREIESAITSKLGIGPGETTEDGRFTLLKVECLGSCGTAPVVQINNDYYENVSEKELEQLLDSLS